MLNKSDFSCVGMVTASCDLQKLCIAVEEAKLFDLEPVLCFGFLTDIFAKWEALPTDPSAELTPEQQQTYDLINGSTYLVGSQTKRHLGIKRVWIYYAYAKYLIINAHSDTPNGLVNKQNEWSMPVPLRELNDLSNKYKNMGRETLQNLREFLCINKEIFPKFDACGCTLSCGCIGACSCGSPIKLSGFRYRSVKK